MCDENTPRARPPPPLMVTIEIDEGPSLHVVRCQICLEDIDASNDATIALTTCGHRFCVACIQAFLNVQITDGCVDLVCFHVNGENTCEAEIAIDDVQRLVSSPVFAKYERFRLLRKNPQARQCPFCSFVHVTTGSTAQPACVCSACEKRFCFVHADAHSADESCTQFERRQSKRERRSGRVVRKISRPCPQCAQPIEKNGGCVHMTCSMCKAEYCWWCGETWGFNYVRHYSLLDAECCRGIAHELVPGLDSPATTIRYLARLCYASVFLLVGLPLTILLLVLLAWVWAPAVSRGQYQIRVQALAQFFTIRCIQIVITVAYITVVTVAFIVVVFADGLGWILRKLRAFRPRIPPRIPPWCTCSRHRSAEKESVESEMESPAFVVLHERDTNDISDA